MEKHCEKHCCVSNGIMSDPESLSIFCFVLINGFQLDECSSVETAM